MAQKSTKKLSARIAFEEFVRLHMEKPLSALNNVQLTRSLAHFYFTHRNWMRSANTSGAIKDAVATVAALASTVQTEILR